MNIGVDGEAALRKVASDFGMNDNEVTLVAHAVNNSKQLAHLQTASPDDKENEFPLINPDNVKNPVSPVTNADVNTGDRYGKQELPGDNVEAELDAPDAVGISKELAKAASASYRETADYRIRADSRPSVSELRHAWGLTDEREKTASAISPGNELSTDGYRVAIEEARVRYTAKTAACERIFDRFSNDMSRMTAPKWAEVEKVAAHLGVSQPVLDMMYDASGVERFGDGRADLTIKVAGRLVVAPEVKRLAEECVHVDTLWKEAADIWAAKSILEERRDAIENEVARKLAGVDERKLLSAEGSLNLGAIAQGLETAPADFSGLDKATIRDAFGSAPKSEAVKAKQPDAPFRQDLQSIDTRSAIESLMRDSYISGHSLPDVVEAYNNAVSVHPEMGRGELISYVRQHLATDGGIPLDQHIRARGRAPVERRED